MKKIVNNWHYLSVYLSGISALAFLFPLNTSQVCLVTAIIFLFLHFFEEFGFPGGFPLMGMKVMMNSDEMDYTKWNCNNLNSMFGNWSFLFLVYILPLLFPNFSFLTLSAMLFLFAEVIMHFLIFPIKLKTIYNAGLVTSVGMGIIGIYYFTTVFQANVLTWFDYVLAVAWFIFVFLFSFRSKLYWQLGQKSGYDLTEQTAYGANFKA
ncbi:HXXEE domain-containing protein [Streptococcus sp. sy018]|uniref:HXXEE domain-containing protein n=1 Tax=Streptococcus sp. sy018 TaxID=2600147 RepID=UPI0011B6675D|nr:HXXEE domain-containing protein [Streptococcus sp. sy018]TWS94234.1 HXXEE domain-containing protein [Streptococcus sp. sy018]